MWNGSTSAARKFAVDLNGNVTTGIWQGTAVGVAYGGTGLASYAIGDTLYATAATTLAKRAIGTVGKLTRSDGTHPQWSASTFPDTATAGDLLHASASNTWTSLAIGAAGKIVRSTGTLPAYTAATFPDSAARGDILRASAANTWVALTVGSANTVLLSNGTDPSWGSIVDAHISATAEVAVSKLANGTARQLIQTDAAGTGVEWTSEISLTTVAATTLTGTLSTAAQPNVTSLGTLGTLGVTGLSTLTAGFKTTSGNCYVGDDANANMTLGLTINQGAADDQLFAGKSSDVAHGMTTRVETDTYIDMAKRDATNGGAYIRTYTAGGVALSLVANYTTGDTTKAGNSTAAFEFTAQKKTGTTSGAMGANENLATFANYAAVCFVLDGDGDSHQDVGTSWTNFHGHDDLGLVAALAANVTRHNDPIRRNFNSFLFDRREELERLRLVSFNPDGHHFVNMSRLTMLLVGATQQIATRFERLESDLESLKRLLPGPAVG